MAEERVQHRLAAILAADHEMGALGDSGFGSTLWAGGTG